MVRSSNVNTARLGCYSGADCNRGYRWGRKALDVDGSNANYDRRGNPKHYSSFFSSRDWSGCAQKAGAAAVSGAEKTHHDGGGARAGSIAEE